MSRIEHYPINTQGRDFVVGDLHGCRAAFDRLLIDIGFDRAVDRMFSVGDLADRGPDSRGCLALLQEPWFHAVVGNHEQILLMAAVEGDAFNWQWWIDNGGVWARGLMREELLEYASQIIALPLAISIGEGADRINIIHAEFFGSDADLDDALGNPETKRPNPELSLLWGREMVEGRVNPSKQAGLSLTFCGHTVVESIGRIGNQIYIDTGAYRAEFWKDHSVYALTMVELRTRTFWRSLAEGTPS